jgi:hypothetical protein
MKVRHVLLEGSRTFFSALSSAMMFPDIVSKVKAQSSQVENVKVGKVAALMSTLERRSE